MWRGNTKALLGNWENVKVPPLSRLSLRIPAHQGTKGELITAGIPQSGSALGFLMLLWFVPGERRFWPRVRWCQAYLNCVCRNKRAMISLFVEHTGEWKVSREAIYWHSFENTFVQLQYPLLKVFFEYLATGGILQTRMSSRGGGSICLTDSLREDRKIQIYSN